MDLKLEIRKLAALHEATIRLKHGIKEVDQTLWNDYAPSGFVYAFFTFNSIYSFDWESSFRDKKVVRWEPDKLGKMLREEDQIKAYLCCMDSLIKPETAGLLSSDLSIQLKRHDISDPVEELMQVDIVNATNKVKNLAKQMPGKFKNLLSAKVKPEDLFADLCAILRFVYAVRCNLFHGSKTHVELLDLKQQRRILIYSSILIATNALLFKAAETVDIGWESVKVDFTVPTAV